MAPSKRTYPGMGAFVILLHSERTDTWIPYAGATTDDRARSKARRELRRHPSGSWRVVPNDASAAEPAPPAPEPAPALFGAWDREVGGAVGADGTVYSDADGGL